MTWSPGYNCKIKKEAGQALTNLALKCLIFFGLATGACLMVFAMDTNKPHQIQADNQFNGAKIPVIGILTQVLRDYKKFTDVKHLHLAASYVKWIESAGAQVLPILLNQDDAYYERIFKQTNGLLFPGGDNLLDPHKDTPMMVAAKKLYKLAIEANDRGDFYPIWGTCLGLELLSVLSSDQNVLVECQANDLSLKMEFVGRGRMFAPADYGDLGLVKDYAESIVNALATKNVSYNHHQFCLTDEAMQSVGLDKFYKPLAYSSDPNGVKFIAIFEAIRYPFYGVQFHPEKAPFEFVIKSYQKQVPHSSTAVAVSRFFADFFVRSAQLSSHQPWATQGLAQTLIYAHEPMYTAVKGDMYEQRYLFPYKDNSLSTEEFIHHVPGENELIPEKVERKSRETLRADASPVTGTAENRLTQNLFLFRRPKVPEVRHESRRKTITSYQHLKHYQSPS